MIVQENGKLYKIDEDTGLVTEASVMDADGQDVLDREDLEEEIRIGDRVEFNGQLGEVISVTASVYGPAFGIRYDNGDVDELPEGQIKRSSVEKPDYKRPVDEVQARFEIYETLPAFTNDEINLKEREARWLNLRSKSLVTDTKLAFSDQTDLARIVLVTGTDLIDLKELREKSEDTQDYLSRFNRYSVASEVNGHGATLGVQGDASWLEGALEGMEIVETTDEDLAARATEVAATLTREQLENDESIAYAASYQRDYLQMNDDQAKKFASYLENARKERLAESVEKVASNDGLDDIDDSAIFLS